MKKQLCIVIFFLCATFAFCDEMSALKFIVRNNPITRDASFTEPKGTGFDIENESSLLSILLIRLYQVVISPQTPPSCIFYPSCSQYGLLSIKKYGVILGILMTADRLERCNRGALRGYPFHPETGRRFDPPERNIP
jgi:putative membrane protein insertion efficiency factor